MHQLFFVFTNHIDMWVWMIFFTLYVMEGQADSIYGTYQAGWNARALH